MVTLRPGQERGHTQFDWLDSWHTFSFDRYYDPKHMSFRHLRVLNEDRVAPGGGFPTHPHRDMEIVTYVLEGALQHSDSMGNGSAIKPGEVQRMSAGTGITHSEYNQSQSEPVHLLQIWILPERRGLVPSYEQRAFAIGEDSGALRLVASPDGRQGTVTIHQDVELFAGRLKAGETASHRLQPGRHGWVQVARGKVEVNGVVLEAGDGAAVSQEETVKLEASQPAEVLLFDLA